MKDFIRILAWIASFFLWFVTPTGAAELWEKWTREKEERESKKDHSGDIQ